MRTLDGKTAVVTDGDSRIGLATAKMPLRSVSKATEPYCG